MKSIYTDADDSVANGLNESIPLVHDGQPTTVQGSRESISTDVDHGKINVEIDIQDVIEPTMNKLTWKTIKIDLYSFICLLICWTLSSAMAVMGIVHIDECPKQTYIPIFLVVGGVLTVLSSTALYFNGLKAVFSLNRCLISISNMLYGLTFSWYILGCITVYGAYKPQFEQSDLQEFCHRDLYLFSFWLFNAFFIICGVFTFIVVLLFIMGFIENTCKN